MESFELTKKKSFHCKISVACIQLNFNGICYAAYVQQSFIQLFDSFFLSQFMFQSNWLHKDYIRKYHIDNINPYPF